LLAAPAYLRHLPAPELELPEGGRVHVVAPDIRSGDAVGNLALDVARALRRHGVEVQLWANQFGDDLFGGVLHANRLGDHVRAEDVVFYQYSTGDPSLDVVLGAPCPKLCFYQGITPPELLAEVEPEAAAVCAAGQRALPRLAGFDGFLAGSSFMAGELRDALGEAAEIGIAPPTLGLDRFRSLEAKPVAPPGVARFLLYVGRFAPHKGIDFLIDAFAAHAELDPTCDLVLAGSPAGEAFVARLAAHRAALPGALGARVHVIACPTDAQLKSLYGTCSAYVSASEHEGFGLPLAEALGFGKPVFARETPAVRETLGGAGRLFSERDPRSLAEGWRELLTDPATRAAQRSAAGRRFQELRSAADGRRIWRALPAVISRAARVS